LIAGGQPIILPAITKPYEEHLPDYEVELAIVIGKLAKNVSEDDALNYVLGYTGANDVRILFIPVISCRLRDSVRCPLESGNE
jgi:2-keto-4-pentenoate hydratase/2-oxohepta-3-ene-1,7-dioic acid hydratase in catechol pathway